MNLDPARRLCVGCAAKQEPKRVPHMSRVTAMEFYKDPGSPYQMWRVRKRHSAASRIKHGAAHNDSLQHAALYNSKLSVLSLGIIEDDFDDTPVDRIVAELLLAYAPRDARSRWDGA
jgi:hypothetical protein